MHETSLIEFTLDAVEKKAKSMNIDRVGEICIVAGRLAAVPRLLDKAFDIMKYNRPMFEHAKLTVDCREGEELYIDYFTAEE
ncbi:MAG: hydrogenase maturation nickel metallochaperone HypA [Eubacterium sp.]|nr:hydrogenase maturation nickel metallochaperone HypA [Eubacterium sp.]